MQKITLIVAMSNHHIIGNNHQLPWHLPNDLKRFKALTMGKPIVMGRKTFDSIGKPLPGRKNIVLTHSPVWSAAGCTTMHSLEAVLALEDKEIMIIGGGAIYRLFYPFATTMHITYVHCTVQGDTTFLDFPQEDWKTVEKQHGTRDAQHAYDYDFVTLVRRAHPLC